MEHTFDENLFSDLHKDVYGFRPSIHHVFYVIDDPDEKQKIWDDLLISHEQEMKDAEMREQSAIKSFEDLINTMITYGAENRKTAIRWLVVSIDDHYDGGYLCYEFHLPYGGKYENEFNGALKEIL